MNQFLAILNDVMRIATFQWQGQALHGCHPERRDPASHHAPWTDRQPIRRFRP
jgi:hypothetical protein